MRQSEGRGRVNGALHSRCLSSLGDQRVATHHAADEAGWSSRQPSQIQRELNNDDEADDEAGDEADNEADDEAVR